MFVIGELIHVVCVFVPAAELKLIEFVVGVSVGVVRAVPVPQPFVAVTETVPAPLPIVMVADDVVPPDVTAQPVPVTDHVYDAAPETAAMLNVLPVEPAHKLAGCVIVPGCEGTAVGVIFTVCAALVPHAFVAVTETVPAPLPIVMVADDVVPPDVTAQPVPVTDHVYDAAPETAAMLNVLPVEPAHKLAGCVIVPGCDGAVIGVSVEVV